MPKDVGHRRTTFLVAAALGAADAPVYAVTARSAEAALASVRGLGHPAAAVVGSLSSRTAKALRLAAGEVRAV